MSARVRCPLARPAVSKSSRYLRSDLSSGENCCFFIFTTIGQLPNAQASSVASLDLLIGIITKIGTTGAKTSGLISESN